MNAFNPGVAVVAGVGPGLGASLARKCAKEGCQVGLLARSSDFLETLTNELRGLGTKVLAVSTDISEADQVAAAFRRIGEELGPVDLLINNASASGPFRQPFVEITPESFTRLRRMATLGWSGPKLASSMANAPLTSFNYSKEAHGRSAIELVLEQIDNAEKSAPKVIEVPVDLVVRESTARPKERFSKARLKSRSSKT